MYCSLYLTQALSCNTQSHAINVVGLHSGIDTSSVSSLEDLRAEFKRAKELALEGSKIEVFDVFKDDFVEQHQPDLATYAKVLELEARVAIALNAKSGDKDPTDTIDVGVAELREILEGLEKNGATATDNASRSA